MFPALLGIRFQYLCGLCPLSLFLLLVRRLKATRFNDVLKYVLKFDILLIRYIINKCLTYFLMCYKLQRAFFCAPASKQVAA